MMCMIGHSAAGRLDLGQTAALEYFAGIGLLSEDTEKIMNTNARRILGLRDPLLVAAE